MFGRIKFVPIVKKERLGARIVRKTSLGVIDSLIKWAGCKANREFEKSQKQFWEENARKDIQHKDKLQLIVDDTPNSTMRFNEGITRRNEKLDEIEKMRIEERVKENPLLLLPALNYSKNEWSIDRYINIEKFSYNTGKIITLPKSDGNYGYEYNKETGEIVKVLIFKVFQNNKERRFAEEGISKYSEDFSIGRNKVFEDLFKSNGRTIYVDYFKDLSEWFEHEVFNAKTFSKKYGNPKSMLFELDSDTIFVNKNFKEWVSRYWNNIKDEERSGLFRYLGIKEYSYSVSMGFEKDRDNFIRWAQRLFEMSCREFLKEEMQNMRSIHE